MAIINSLKRVSFKIVIIFLLILSVKPIEEEPLQISERITHGQPAQPGQFPWYVIIKDPDYSNIHCGGSLISPHWVITAGHCLYSKATLRLYLGSNVLRNPAALTMWSQQFYISPGYDDQTYDNDIGLVRLPEAAAMTMYIQPIGLLSRAMAQKNLVGKKALIIGFGLLSDELPNSYPPNSFFASVVIISNEECQRKFPFILPLNCMCSEGATASNEKICDGDSGGGLVTRNDEGANVLIGINSFGSQKCTRKPSGYASIGRFLDWIQNITKLPLK